MAEGREEGIEERGPGGGAGRAEEMIVNEPVNPLIKYSKPVSPLTSVEKRRRRRRRKLEEGKGLYDRNESGRSEEGRFSVAELRGEKGSLLSGV